MNKANKAMSKEMAELHTRKELKRIRRMAKRAIKLKREKQ